MSVLTDKNHLAELVCHVHVQDGKLVVEIGKERCQSFAQFTFDQFKILELVSVCQKCGSKVDATTCTPNAAVIFFTSGMCQECVDKVLGEMYG